MSPKKLAKIKIDLKSRKEAIWLIRSLWSKWRANLAVSTIRETSWTYWEVWIEGQQTVPWYSQLPKTYESSRLGLIASLLNRVKSKPFRLMRRTTFLRISSEGTCFSRCLTLRSFSETNIGKFGSERGLKIQQNPRMSQKRIERGTLLLN